MKNDYSRLLAKKLPTCALANMSKNVPAMRSLLKMLLYSFSDNQLTVNLRPASDQRWPTHVSQIRICTISLRNHKMHVFIQFSHNAQVQLVMYCFAVGVTSIQLEKSLNVGFVCRLEALYTPSWKYGKLRDKRAVPWVPPHGVPLLHITPLQPQTPPVMKMPAMVSLFVHLFTQ